MEGESIRHIHRRQLLIRDLAGRRLKAPVVYPGSMDRVSFAERFEPKGYVVTCFEGAEGGGRVTSIRFCELPTRPMEVVRVEVAGVGADELQARLRRALEGVAADAIVQLRLEGTARSEALRVLRAESLRRLAPATITLEVAVPRGSRPDSR